VDDSEFKHWPRVIVLADMNAFFASIEQVDHPNWRTRPVAITNGKIGTCIITCSYQARAFGVKTGMHIKQARMLCPELIQTCSRPQRYAEVSSNIMRVLSSFTPDLEIFSVDEAFLDMSLHRQLWQSPEQLGKAIKRAIYEVSGVLSSVGISADKSTAKVAAKEHKPDGLSIIPPDEVKSYLAPKPLTDLCGVNYGIASHLAEYDVFTCEDLGRMPISVMAKRFGNPGRRIWLMAQGLDPEPVKTQIPDIQTLGHGKVLPPNCQDINAILTFLRHMAHKVGERLRRNQLAADQFLIGFRLYSNWMKTKLSTPLPCDDDTVIYRLGRHWLEQHWRGQGIWQIHIVALNPKECRQPDLFLRKHPARLKTHQVLDAINQKYGSMTLSSARLINKSTMPDVISPAWKPSGARKTI
jgi:DNA polymerase-4